MSARGKTGGVMMILGVLVYLLAGLLAMGSLFNGCVAVARGSFVEFVFSVGLAVVIGWVGQIVGGLIMAGGAVVSGD